MARPYNVNNDPIRLGLESLRSGIEKGQERSAREREMALNERLRQKQMEQIGAELDFKKAQADREQKKFDVEFGDTEITPEYVAALGEDVAGPMRQEYLNRAVEGVVDDPYAPVPKWTRTARQQKDLANALELRAKAAQAKKAAAEKPTIDVRRGDYNKQFGLPENSGGDPSDIISVPAPALTRPVAPKPGEQKTVSPDFAKAIGRVESGEIPLAAAATFIKTAGDQNTFNQIAASVRGERTADRADERTIKGQLFSAAEAVKNRLFQSGEKEKDRGASREGRLEGYGFTASENEKNRAATLAGQKEGRAFTGEQNALARAIQERRAKLEEKRLRAQIEKDRLAEEENVIGGDVADLFKKEGLPVPGTKAERDAMKMLKEGGAKVDNNKVSPEMRQAYADWQAGKIKASQIPALPNETTADRSIRNAALSEERNRATQAGIQDRFIKTKEKGEQDRQYGIINTVIGQMSDDFRQNTKEIVEGKAVISSTIPDLLSLESGRAEAAQQKLASILNKGRPTDADYARAGITSGAKDKLRAYFSALVTGKVPPDIGANRAAFFADAEKVLNARYESEADSAVSQVKQRLAQSGVTQIPSDQEIRAAIGVPRLSVDTPAASAKKDLDEKAKPPGLRKQDMSQRPQGKSDAALVGEARAAIRRGAPKEAVLKQLADWGVKGSP